MSTGRCTRTLKFDLPVKDVAWNPNSSYSTVAAAVYDFIIFDFCASFCLFFSQIHQRLICTQADSGDAGSHSELELRVLNIIYDHIQ